MGKIKKLSIAAVVGGLVLAGAGVAYAYWSVGGSGTGTATVATGGTDLQISGSPSGAVTPGGNADYTLTITNPNKFAVSIGGKAIAATVTKTDKVGCLASDFALTIGVPDNNTMVAKNGGTVTVPATLSMKDQSYNQDNCKGAGLTISYSMT